MRPAVPSPSSLSSTSSSSNRKSARLHARVCTVLAERSSVPGPYTQWIMAGKRARDVPATTYLRDRESTRTLLVICGPYQMRPRSFHHVPRSAVRSASLALPFLLLRCSPSPSPPVSRHSATEILSFESPTTTFSHNISTSGSFFNRRSNPTAQGNSHASTLRTPRS